MLQASLFILLGLVLLTFAADRFVVAAARLSRLWEISPILIGALVVGMGTSAPELLVGVLAAMDGELNLALGNVVGSNVANVTLVLGASAIIRPIAGQPGVLRREGVLMLCSVILLSVFLWDLELARWEAGVLAGGMAVAALLLVRWARTDKTRGGNLADDVQEILGSNESSWPREVTFGTMAMALTLVGAELLVTGGTAVAEHMGLSSAFIGMTIIAVGTSLPELATATAGARRGEDELVIGNVLGSNLFNTLAVAGAAGLVDVGSVDPGFTAAVIAMVCTAAVAGFFAFTGAKIVRWEGGVLLAGFVAFLILVR